MKKANGQGGSTLLQEELLPKKARAFFLTLFAQPDSDGAIPHRHRDAKEAKKLFYNKFRNLGQALPHGIP